MEILPLISVATIALSLATSPQRPADTAERRQNRGTARAKERGENANEETSVLTKCLLGYELVYYPTRVREREDNYYRFRIVRLVGGYRCYIMRSPSYGKRCTDSVRTHRFGLDQIGPPYVCWSVSIATVRDAEAVCKIWADYTQKYIRTGICIV